MVDVRFPKPEVVLSQLCIGMQIDILFLKQVPSLNLNPEVDFDCMTAILQNRYGVITPPWIVELRRNLAS